MKLPICMLAPMKQEGLRLPSDYARALVAAGGRAYIVTQRLAVPPAALARMCSGLMLIGGADLEPSLYGQEMHEKTELDAPGRDAAELALYRAFRAAGRPVLGICRGMQLIHVAEGGTLYQHLPELRWLHAPHSGQELRHEVWLAPDSLLARAFGRRRLVVNSRHHQAADRVAPGLRVAATDPFGLPEALEAPGVLAVQWHPENLGDTMLPLFRLFVGACRDFPQPAGQIHC